MTDTPAPAPGWYPDPSGSAGLRWWDGERMWGFAEGFEKGTGGFFFFPTDPGTNNLRVYVVRSALRNAVLIDN